MDLEDVVDGGNVVMRIGMIGDNYVKFQMTMTEKPVRSGEPESPDGSWVWP
jgi:hypothetical protein